jgi:hypothetical protein
MQSSMGGVGPCDNAQSHWIPLIAAHFVSVTGAGTTGSIVSCSEFQSPPLRLGNWSTLSLDLAGH